MAVRRCVSAAFRRHVSSACFGVAFRQRVSASRFVSAFPCHVSSVRFGIAFRRHDCLYCHVAPRFTSSGFVVTIVCIVT
jgi:hypothetical protein